MVAPVSPAWSLNQKFPQWESSIPEKQHALNDAYTDVSLLRWANGRLTIPLTMVAGTEGEGLNWRWAIEKVSRLNLQCKRLIPMRLSYGGAPFAFETIIILIFALRSYCGIFRIVVR